MSKRFTVIHNPETKEVWMECSLCYPEKSKTLPSKTFETIGEAISYNAELVTDGFRTIKGCFHVDG